MKNKTIKVAVVSVFAAIAGYGVYTSQKTVGVSDLLLEDVEAQAYCEITTKRGTVKLECDGKGTCEETYMGYTLTCNGKKRK